MIALDILKIYFLTSKMVAIFEAEISPKLVFISAVIGVLVLLLFKLSNWYINYRKLVKIYSQFPHDKVHWLWGNFLEHPGPGQDGLEWQMQKSVEHPYFAAVWFSKLRCIIICNHFELAKKLLQMPAFQSPKPRGPGSSYEIGLPWLGEGLLIANGERWARNRKLLTPAFHFNILQPYVHIVNDCTDILVKKLEDFARKKESFELYHHVNLCSLDVITRCAFSYPTNCQEQGESHPYVKAVHRLSELWMYRALNPFIAFDWIYFNLTREGREFTRLCRLVHNVSESIIQNRRAHLNEQSNSNNHMESGEKKILDFLDIILTSKDEDGKGLTDLEIRNEVDTFLFEGHDTTTSAMSFILLSLAEHPDIQQKCRQEIEDILKDRETDEIMWKDLPQLKYLTQCIKEGLRLHSPVFFIQRKILEDIEYDKYVIPAGAYIGLDINNINHNELTWGKDHSEFKPDRFSPEKIKHMDPFSFIPFSAGQRNCIGQNFAMNEIKVVVAKLIYKFRFALQPGHVVRKRLGVVMRTENGMWMNAKTIKRE